MTVTQTIPQGHQKQLERWVRLVDQTLDRLLPKTVASPQVVHEAMRYCVLVGGKRYRPLLCLGACQAVGSPARQALTVACALELIHTYSLVHDDLPAMDNADERRGQAACHRKFGEGNAILVGDALLTLAFEWLSRNGIPRLRSGCRPERSRMDGTPNALAIIRTIGQACGTTGLIGGQVLDLQAISRPLSATERALTDIADRKTAALMSASVVAGALAGGATAAQLRTLKRFGHQLGLAFQLIDDVHDQDGLASAIGLDTAKTRVQYLIRQATNLLVPFRARARILRQMTAWLQTTI